jgi:hypothetical protein
MVNNEKEIEHMKERILIFFHNLFFLCVIFMSLLFGYYLLID